MRHRFCTYFDSRYLSRGLVLYRSLAQVCPEFRLRIYCMDDATESALAHLQLPHVELVPLRELEAYDPDLLGVKPDRSPTEYYWTATPVVCRHALDADPGLETITYLDADLMFFADPQPLFDELGDGSVLLVPHRYSPEFELDNISGGTSADSGGIFNVQWLTFRRDQNGLGALQWWRDRCIEWCYDRVEPGRYGDQKYLDDWPTRFAGVHVLEHPGGGLAPWNVSRYALEREGERISVDGWPLIFHHYQSLRLHDSTRFSRALAAVSPHYRRVDAPFELVWSVGWRPLREVLDLIWNPYAARVAEAVGDLSAIVGARALGVGRLRSIDAAMHIARLRLPRWARRAYWRLRRSGATATAPSERQPASAADRGAG